MTNRELANEIISLAKNNNAVIDMTESQLTKVKKAELEALYNDFFEFDELFDFSVYDEYEEPKVEEPNNDNEEPKAEEPKLTFKRVAQSVRNFEQLLDTLTFNNLAVSYTNRRIVTDAMLFCKRAKYIARVYVKNSYETLIDEWLEPYDGYKGYYDIKDNDDLDLVIVALQSATRVHKKRVTNMAADRIKK